MHGWFCEGWLSLRLGCAALQRNVVLWWYFGALVFCSFLVQLWGRKLRP
jgi:hypothetical protein